MSHWLKTGRKVISTVLSLPPLLVLAQARQMCQTQIHSEAKIENFFFFFLKSQDNINMYEKKSSTWVFFFSFFKVTLFLLIILHCHMYKVHSVQFQILVSPVKHTHKQTNQLLKTCDNISEWYINNTNLNSKYWQDFWCKIKTGLIRGWAATVNSTQVEQIKCWQQLVLRLRACVRLRARVCFLVADRIWSYSTKYPIDVLSSARCNI